MNPRVVLGAVAAAQLALAVAAWTWSTPGGPPAATPFTQARPEAVTGLKIWDNPEKAEPEVALVRGASGWELAGSGVAVDGVKVDELLDNLLEQPPRPPIANSATSWSRLGVSDKEWIRKVEVSAGEASFTAVLGGGRDSHLRVVGKDTVYALESLKPWSILSAPYSWLPSPFHRVDTARVVKLEFRRPDSVFSVARVDPGSPWAWTPEAPGVPLDGGKVTAALEALAEITASGLPTDPKAPVDGVEVAWTLDDGASASIRIGPEDAMKVPVWASSRGHAVLASVGPLAPLVGASVETWTAQEAPPEPEAPLP